MSDIWIKKSNTNPKWAKALSIKIKRFSSTWVAAKAVWIKNSSVGWLRVWPTSGVFSITSPYITTASVSAPLYGNNTVAANDVIRIGTTYYGRNGIWDANGFSISSYNYLWPYYSTVDQGISYDELGNLGSGVFVSPYKELTISTAGDATASDGKFISFRITANASNVLYSNTADSKDSYGKIQVIRRTPQNTSASISGYTAVGGTLSFGSAWNASEAYKPDAARSTIVWYKSNSNTSIYNGQGRTQISSGSYSYVVQSADLGKYIVAEETVFNTGSDFDIGLNLFTNGQNQITRVTSIITASTPTQLTAPTISGSGIAFSEVNGVSGTYQSGSFLSKTVYIGRSFSSSPPTSGSTTALESAGSPPYKITQNDVTAPKYYFYYVDKVKSNNNIDIYYYYSTALPGSVGFPIEDNYNRTVISGLETMTPVLNLFMSPNSYQYNSTRNGSTWSTNGSFGVNASSVSGTNPSTYNLQSLEIGKTNLTSSVEFPGGPDGLGLVFWASDSLSWWASTVYLNSTSSTLTSYTYYQLGAAPCNQGPFTTTGTPPANCSQSSTSVTTYTWYQNVSTTSYGCTGDGAFSKAQATGACNSSRVGLPCTLVSSPTFNDPYYRYKMCVSSTSTTCNGGPYSSTTYPIVYCSTPTVNTVTTTTYYTLGSAPCNQGPFTSYSPPGVYCGSYTTNSITTTNYKTNLRILSSNGSTVTTEKQTEIGSSTSSFPSVIKMKVVTSGDTITATGYSDNAMTSITGSHSYLASGSVKSSNSGFSAAGIIKTPHGFTQGVYFDNLKIE